MCVFCCLSRLTGYSTLGFLIDVNLFIGMFVVLLFVSLVICILSSTMLTGYYFVLGCLSLTVS